MSNKSIDDDFNLALKFFINKNFQKSFQIICGLYLKGVDEYQNGHMTKKMFTKIVNLYLVEVGLILKNNEQILSSNELDGIVGDIKNDRVFNYIEKAYGNDDSIPNEVLYNIGLIYNLNSSKISNDYSWLLIRFEKIYSLSNVKIDVFAQRIKDLYVYEVLPKLKKSDSSRVIINSDSYYQSDIQGALKKLESVENIIKKNEKLELEKQREREILEKALLEKSIQKKKEMTLKNDLKYRSHQTIQQQYLKDSNESTSSSHTIESKEKLINRFKSIINITKNYTKQNYQLILIIIVSLTISTTFIRRRRINITEKLRETLKMAFKISYL